MVGMILSLLFISFARLKDEDEYTVNLRMKSMAWSFKVFGIVVIVATLTIYGMIWFIVMLILVYLIFFLFIGKFYYELHKFRKEAQNEE
jgi:fatty acid desaturase